MPEENVDTSALEAEVEKSLDEGTNSEAAAEKTSEEKVDSAEKLDSEKTVEKTEASDDKVKDDEDRFDKHPRFQKLIQERDALKTEKEEALREANEARVIKETLGDMSLEELNRLKSASGLLKKYPKLREQVQKMLDEYPYGNEEVKGEVDNLKSELAKDREERLLDKYDNQVEKLMIEKKVDSDIKSMVKEILDNRVVNQKITLENVPKAFEKVLKDIETFKRKTLASHIEDKSKEKTIPPTTKSKGKESVAKKEPEETEDLVNDIASELKASSNKFGEE